MRDDLLAHRARPVCAIAVHPPSQPQFAWSARVAPLAAALADRLRSRQLALVGRAYASISVPKLAALLGCSEAEAAQGEAACLPARVMSTSLIAG